MKYIVAFSLFLLVNCQVFTQDIKNYNLDNGVIAKGYDVVAYFSNKAKKGKESTSYLYQGIKFYFSSEKNLNTYKENPKKYIPQYGGYCAYAIAKKGKKVSINPKTFEIRDGKLYLFYNAMFTNTLEMWLEENPSQLQIKANENWIKIIK